MEKVKWFYKGVKIRKWHRDLLWKAIGGVLLLPCLVSLAVIGWRQDFHYSVRTLSWCVAIGLSISALAAALMARVWRHLYRLQKLCRMVFGAMYYNLEGEQVDGGKIINYRKDMTYFPGLYYRSRGGSITVTVRLDGSRFHERFTNLGDTLGEMFDMEATSVARKYWYMVYTLESIQEERLHLGKDVIVCEGTGIPLMKGLTWDFKDTPHALITGVTGGGKSYFLYYLIRSLVSLDSVIKVIDPKRSDLYGLRQILGEANVAYGTGKVMGMCRSLTKEMEARYEKLDAAAFGADYTALGLKPVFLFFDEFIAFVESIERPEDSRNLMSFLTRIILEGRQAGVYVIFATQRADAKYLSGAIRDNLGLRVSLGALEKAGYRMTFGDVDKKFEKFGRGHGYIWINGITDTVREFYAPYLGEGYDPEKDLEGLLAQTAKPGVPRSGTSGSNKGEAVWGEAEGRASTTPLY